MTPTEGNRATPNRPEGARPLNAPLLLANLQDYAHQLKSEVAWETNDRNAITLVHTPHLRLVLMVLHQSAEIKDHKVDGPSTLQLIKGRLWLETSAESITMDAGEVAALEPGLPHAIFAEEESTLLLTIAGQADPF